MTGITTAISAAASSPSSGLASMRTTLGITGTTAAPMSIRGPGGGGATALHTTTAAITAGDRNADRKKRALAVARARSKGKGPDRGPKSPDRLVGQRLYDA